MASTTHGCRPLFKNLNLLYVAFTSTNFVFIIIMFLNQNKFFHSGKKQFKYSFTKRLLSNYNYNIGVKPPNIM